MVGKPLVEAINALIHSISRLISPPDATSATRRSDWLRLAANINCTSSLPVGIKSAVGVICTATFACFTPRRCMSAMRREAIWLHGERRDWVSASAALLRALWAASTSPCRRAISSSKFANCCICHPNSSCIAISSAMVCTRCFFISVCSMLCRSCTCSRRIGSRSVWS